MSDLTVLALSLSDWMEKLASDYGYFGIFLISFIGSVSIIIPIPYTIVLYLMGTVLDPVFIAIAGGLGSGLGETFGYLLGYFGRAIISEEKQRKIDFMLKIFRRYGSIMVFLFALTPLPDDLLFIPLGIMRYNFIKVFIPCILGKIMMGFILAMGGRLSINIIKSILGEGGGWWTTIIMLVLLALIIIVMLRVDWEKIFTQYIEKREKE